MAVSAFPDVKKTHSPESVQATKKLEKEIFISLNLLSSPTLMILEKRNIPSRKDHMLTKSISTKDRSVSLDPKFSII